ncbi:RING-15 protein [Sodiomyces alkalinus F11]|uniref:RING-15 protein n=1 Tax=Sodiomyces alkalinus (strain CBS 110278 / VKM F-3762 / F11) TaxID=1314773 RepID=A0A3N2Q3C0_SODAK|nr:RING-15 protein [Sodiomyces alkalinus F11]ROT41207.1 RING-15 protein [Sodiomyces alkalinus F11]
MSSTPASLGKSLPVSTSHPPAAQQGHATSSFETSRRPSQTGPSLPHAVPRKGQTTRKQHKNQRRPGLGGHRQNPDDDDAMAEIRALRNASSRRGQTSITHLLDYSLPPRHYYQDHHNHHHSHPRSYRRNPTWGPGSGHHPADKARYVHANYRFVVSPDGDYSTQAVNADEHLQWGDILQILASAESQATSCPICLSEPVAPRMAKCGHIFCLSCLIRFMNASGSDDDKNKPPTIRGARWKKCPICEDSVFLHDTRPVRFYAGQESPLPRVGDDVVLRLMARTAKSTLALPWEGGSDVLGVEDEVPWHFAANVMDYARIIKGTAHYMLEQYDEEVEALRRQEAEDHLLYHEDDEWTQKAIRAVTAAKEKIQDLGQGGSNGASASVQPEFYFFSSQPHLYLSALDIRILKAKYGDYSAFPSTLLPRVEHISTGHVLDDVQRKRAKYLGHLPRGCVISFLECDWTDIVPAEILDKFAPDIERRRKRNRDKAAQEDRERQQAERLEAAALLRSATGSRRQFDEPIEEDRVPDLNSDDFLPLSSSNHAGTTPPESRPGFGPLASLSTSPSAQRTVWGTRAIPTSPNLAPALAPDLAPPVRRGPVDDGWLREDEFLDAAELSFQMEAMGIEGSSSSGGSGAPRGGGSAGAGSGKGKKKKQKITLMSTGGRRGN